MPVVALKTPYFNVAAKHVEFLAAPYAKDDPVHLGGEPRFWRIEQDGDEWVVRGYRQRELEEDDE